MSNRAFKSVAAIFSLLLFTAISAHAGPVSYGEVVQVFGNLNSGAHTQELRLRSVSQTGSAPVSSDTTSTTVTSSGNGSDSATVSLISTASGPQEGQQGNVEVIQEGDVTGTVCDCGEIRIPGGFKFPWLALGGVPLVCLTGICSSDNPPECIGDCNPPPPQIPEPATLFLLGSGLVALGAKARRRFRPSQSQTDTSDDSKV